MGGAPDVSAARKGVALELREQFIKSELSSCRHFNGIQHDKCKAGVTYVKWKQGVDERAMPCLPSMVHEREVWPCELFEIMSQSDAEKAADARIDSLNRTVKAMRAAKDDAKAKGFRKGSGGISEIACPCCDGGKLRYSVANYNGHMHARCSTNGCVSWME